MIKWNAFEYTVKPVLSGHPQKDQNWVLSLNAGQSIAECSNGGILQYFRPALSYHMALRPWFRLFLSDRLRQVSLYIAQVIRRQQFAGNRFFCRIMVNFFSVGRESCP